MSCQVPLKATRLCDWPRQRPPEQTVRKALEPPTPGPGLRPTIPGRCRDIRSPAGTQMWPGVTAEPGAHDHARPLGPEPAPGAL